jgi:hypothetical protein
MDNFISHKQKLVKLAGPEEGGVNDPRTGLPIYVTTTVRKKYREYFSEEKSLKYDRELYSDLRNQQLNQIIAQDFASSANGVVHHFLANSSDVASGKRHWIEIRKVYTMRRPFNIFLSIIGSSHITIIGVTTSYFKPKKPRMMSPKAFN